MISKRERWGWYLFDFANSILIINGGLYFPQWIVIDNNVSDLWFNLTLTLSTLLLLITGPLLGILSDRGWGRISFLRYTSLAIFLAGLVIGIGGIHIADHNVRVIVSMAAFFVIMYCYQLSLIFYNVLLARVSSPEHSARVSGKGFAWGWIGGIVGIFLIMPFVQGHVPFFQPGGRIQAILPSTLIFGVLTIISFVLLKKDDVTEQIIEKMKISVPRLYRDWLVEFKKIATNKIIWFFLLSYLFFSDAILTIQNNSTIYMEMVYKFSDDIKAYQFLSILTFGAIGAWISGYLADKYSLKRVLLWALVGWAIAVFSAGFVINTVFFTILFAFMGFLNGIVFSVSRVLFLKIIPDLRRGEYFGIYSVFERFASILGPLIWSAPVVLLHNAGVMRYQLAMIAMGVLLTVSVFFLLRMPLASNANFKQQLR